MPLIFCKIKQRKSNLSIQLMLILVRTTGLVVSGASVIAERANLFAKVERQPHSVQGQTNAMQFADKTQFCFKSAVA